MVAATLLVDGGARKPVDDDCAQGAHRVGERLHDRRHQHRLERLGGLALVAGFLREVAAGSRRTVSRG
ncbi:MAG: hypothetical protein ACREM8_14525 [Vulcanimicrobiaceae bacterium]